MTVSRREFMLTTCAASLHASRSHAKACQHDEVDHTQRYAPAPPNEGWFDKPMRWAQLTLVENDPPTFDLAFWLDYFRRTRSDAACLSAGGCVAYYPTEIRLHHRSAWLGSRDVFGELFEGCRKLGMVVIARTDPHAFHQDVHDAHPDWVAVDAEGQKRRHWASPEMWVACTLGPYSFDFMNDVHREIVTRYGVDGIFANRWAGSGICYCEHCRKNFKAATGFDLPRTTNPQDPARRAYLLWSEARLFELWRHWDVTIRAIRPDARFIPNAGGGATSALDMKRVGELADILFADRQARRGLMTPWANGKNAKEYRAALGGKPFGGIFSVGVEEPYRWKDSVQNEAEIRIWVAEATANGMRPWFTKFAGTVYDKRWLPTVEKIYQWHAKAEPYLRNERPLARVGVVYSQQTARFYGGEQARERVEDHTLGFYQALIEGRVPFEMVHDRKLGAEDIGQFKLLVLPNIASLSDAQCALLREFVGRGGGLVATFETSLYDEWGARRANFGLSDLFGARFDGRVEGPMRNAYLTIEREPAGGYHPLVAGLEDAGRIIHGVRRVEVSAVSPLRSKPLTLIPSYPDLPMEKVYPRTPHTDIPEVYVQDAASGLSRTMGRVVYFPWDIDRTFWEVLSVDHGRLLHNAVTWALNEPPIVDVQGPGVIDVTVWQQRSSLTVHLVNLTNPMLMKGPFRELVPVGEQRVRLRLPAGTQAKRVRLLVADKPAPARTQGEHLEVTVPTILDHEVIAIDV
jgi:hypothetical protein